MGEEKDVGRIYAEVEEAVERAMKRLDEFEQKMEAWDKVSKVSEEEMQAFEARVEELRERFWARVERLVELAEEVMRKSKR